MSINKSNYEQYFLDYLDGNLDTGMVAELMVFLAQNPELETELNSFEEITLTPEPISFTGKDFLKKTDSTLARFEDRCIARLEGDMSLKEEKKFDQYLGQNPNKKKEYELFIKTILQPDTSIVFADKDELKKSIKSIPITRWLYPAISVAASILLVVFLYGLLFTGNTGNNTGEEWVAIENDHPSFSINPDSAVANKTGSDDKTNNTGQTTGDKNNTDRQVKEKIGGKKEKTTPVPIKKHKNPVDNIYYFETIGYKQTIAAAPIETINIDIDTKMKLVKGNPVDLVAGLNFPQQNNKTPKVEEEYLSIKELLTSTVKAQLFNKGKKEDKITLWDIAKAGVEGLNRVTGSDISFSTEYDPESDTNILAFNSKNLDFSTKLRKK